MLFLMSGLICVGKREVCVAKKLHTKREGNTIINDLDKLPRFYMFDLNKDGIYQLEERLVDVEVDGINGNEFWLLVDKKKEKNKK